MSKRSFSARHAFSLLELSVVLGIISLVSAAGVTIGSNALKTADRITTQERLATIKQALDSYAKLNGFLPCPANRAITPVSSATAFGVEQRASATACTVTSPGLVSVSNTVPTVRAYTGAVPVRTLGLPDAYAGDAWGAKLNYTVSVNHINHPSNYALNNGTLSIMYGDRTTYGTTFYPITNVTYPITTPTSNGGNLRVDCNPCDLSGNTLGIGTGSLATVYGVVRNGATANVSGNTYPITVSTTFMTLVGATWGTGHTVTSNARVVVHGPGATYAVVSAGPDGRGAFPMNATAQSSYNICVASTASLGSANSSLPCNTTATLTCIDIENCDDGLVAALTATISRGGLVFYDTAYNNDITNASTYFDDFIVWGTNAQARQQVKITNANYDTGLSCSATCEPWCTPCKIGSNKPTDPDSITSPVLCDKIITNSTGAGACRATCIWSGTYGGSYYRCP